MLQARLAEWEVSYVDLEGVLEDGLVKDQSHVDIVEDHFRSLRRWWKRSTASSSRKSAFRLAVFAGGLR